MTTTVDETNTQPLHDIEVMRSSVMIAMTMLLKAYLKSLYGLSEEYVLPWPFP